MFSSYTDMLCLPTLQTEVFIYEVKDLLHTSIVELTTQISFTPHSLLLSFMRWEGDN